MKFRGTLFLLLLTTSRLSSLVISEIFDQGSLYYPSAERYLEIHNNSPTNIDLTSLRLVLPYGTGTVTNSMQKGNFGPLPPGVVTDSMTLPAGGFAVAVTEEIRERARLLPFAAGTVLVKPNNRNGFGRSWMNCTSLIRIIDLSGNTLASLSGNITTNGLEPGMSLVLNNGSYIPSGLSPGFHGQFSFRAAVPLAVSGHDCTMELFYHGFTQENLSIPIITENGIPAGSALFSGTGGIYRSVYNPPPGLPHGSLLILDYAGARLLLRYLDNRPPSVLRGSVWLNEICTDPAGDYSGGGWTGSNGNGTVSETDEFIELVNTGSARVPCRGENAFTVLYESENGPSVRPLSVRTVAGQPAVSNLDPGGYLVLTPEGGLPDNGRITLYDGHPWRAGRVVDSWEYGTMDIAGDGQWNNAPDGRDDGSGLDSLSLYPNAGGNAGRVIKLSASPGRPNGYTNGRVHALLSADRQSVRILVSDTNRADAVLNVFYDSGAASDFLTLSNYGYHYSGIFSIGGPGTAIPSCNGRKIIIRYEDNNPEVIDTFSFYYALPGWELSASGPDLDQALVYPSPAAPGHTKIYLANLPVAAKAVLVSPGGLVMAECRPDDSGQAVWEMELIRGIYKVLLEHNGARRTLLLWVR